MLTKDDLKQLSDLFMPRFNELEKRMDKSEKLFFEFVEYTQGRFYDLEKKIDRKFAEVGIKFDAVDRRFDELQKHLDDTDKRLDRVVTWVSNLEEKIIT